MVGTSPNKEPFDHLKYDVFCKKIGAIFPNEFIDYLLLHNNAELDSNIVKFPNNEINIRYFYGISTRSYTDMESTYEIYKNRLPSKCIPIAEDDCGNQICMSLFTKTYGKIYFFDHEIMDCDEKEVNTISLKDMIFLANSFKNLCEKIEPAKYDDIPVYSPIQVRWNRFVSWLRTKWNKF